MEAYDLGTAVHNPSYLLWVLRKEGEISNRKLGELFSEHDPYEMGYLSRPLRELEAAQLIRRDCEHDTFAITDLADQVLAVLNLRLHELARRRRRNSMTIEPLFHTSDSPRIDADVFVLMPFAESLTGVYRDHIVKVCGELELTCARADDFFTTNQVVHDIWDGIVQSRAVIADCTGRNPNVFYEMGLAHTIGKDVVLITQSEADVPFDIRHRRYIEYKYTPPGMGEFEVKLKRTLSEVVALEAGQQEDGQGR